MIFEGIEEAWMSEIKMITVTPQKCRKIQIGLNSEFKEPGSAKKAGMAAKMKKSGRFRDRKTAAAKPGCKKAIYSSGLFSPK